MENKSCCYCKWIEVDSEEYLFDLICNCPFGECKTKKLENFESNVFDVQ